MIKYTNILDNDFTRGWLNNQNAAELANMFDCPNGAPSTNEIYQNNGETIDKIIGEEYEADSEEEIHERVLTALRTIARAQASDKA